MYATSTPPIQQQPQADIGTAPPWMRKTSTMTDASGNPVQAYAGGAGATGGTYENPPPPPTNGGPNTGVNLPPVDNFPPPPPPTNNSGPYDTRSVQGHTFASYYADQQNALAQQYAAARAAGDPNAMANWRAGLDSLRAHESSRGGGGEIPPPNLNDNSKPGGALYGIGGDGFGAGNQPTPPSGGMGGNPPMATDPATGPQTDTVTIDPREMGARLSPDPSGGDMFKPGGAGGLPPINTDFSGQAQAGADAAYRGATQFLDKDFATARSALETQLTNQGLQPGSEAWNNAISMMERNQNATRQNAAFQAQGVGHQQAGDLLMRALQSRGQLFNEGATLRGQDLQRYGIDQSTNLGRYNTDTSAELARRRLGLDSNSQDFNQLMQLIASSRGGVNMPNFGNPAPLDVTGANSIASSNANAQANRDAQNRAILAQLGGTALSNINWGSLFG